MRILLPNPVAENVLKCSGPVVNDDISAQRFYKRMFLGRCCRRDMSTLQLCQLYGHNPGCSTLRILKHKMLRVVRK